MHVKLVALTASVTLAVTGFAGSAAAASSSCPEARAACQPIGAPGAQKPKPRTQVVRLKLTPKADSSGQLWRAGNHIMQ